MPLATYTQSPSKLKLLRNPVMTCTCTGTYLPAYLPIRLPARLPACPPACPPTCPPARPDVAHLQVSAGWEPGCDIGPVISKEAKARIERLIEVGVKEGATVALDGRGVKVQWG